MKPRPQLRHVMTPFPYSVDVEAPIAQALQLMREHKIKHLPVTEKSALKSLVSDRDIKLVLGPDGAVPPGRDLKVRDVMVENCYVVDLATPLHVVVRHMAEQRLGSALVTRHGKLAGIFTATDACRLFADHLEDAAMVDEENDAA